MMKMKKLALLSLLLSTGNHRLSNRRQRFLHPSLSPAGKRDDGPFFPLTILDVRESDEYAKGHIANAILFPLSTIRPATTAERLPDKDATILVYCQSGRRSKKACILLTKLGYTHIYDFGGIMDWPYDIEVDLDQMTSFSFLLLNPFSFDSTAHRRTVR